MKKKKNAQAVLEKKEPAAKEPVLTVLTVLKESALKESYPWVPTYKWFAKTACIILASLIVIFFALNVILKPYMRQIPQEITPWLGNGK